jgi:hypothetical protein
MTTKILAKRILAWLIIATIIFCFFYSLGLNLSLLFLLTLFKILWCFLWMVGVIILITWCFIED